MVSQCPSPLCACGCRWKGINGRNFFSLLLLLCTNLSELTTALRGAPDLFSPTQVFSCVYFNCRLVSTRRPLPRPWPGH